MESRDCSRLVSGSHMTQKARAGDAVELLVDVPSDYSDAVIPKGARGTVVECYAHPQEGYAVDVAIPDDSLSGGFRYENVVLSPEQFVVREQASGTTTREQ